MSVTEAEVLRAIESITDQTGFPPDAEELAAALQVSTQAIHSALLQAKRRGDVRYDDNSSRLILTEQWVWKQPR